MLVIWYEVDEGQYKATMHPSPIHAVVQDAKQERERPLVLAVAARRPEGQSEAGLGPARVADGDRRRQRGPGPHPALERGGRA
jgi:hypothetical protein